MDGSMSNECGAVDGMGLAGETEIWEEKSPAKLLFVNSKTDMAWSSYILNELLKYNWSYVL
jgi:hypothetical protein